MWISIQPVNAASNIHRAKNHSALPGWMAPCQPLSSKTCPLMTRPAPSGLPCDTADVTVTPASDKICRADLVCYSKKVDKMQEFLTAKRMSLVPSGLVFVEG